MVGVSSFLFLMRETEHKIKVYGSDPHYGIPVCRKAFERIDPKLREQMALRFTKGEARYIGGSADTVYIPAHLKDPFLDILGTFLETSCFLEIAVPTAVHLILPDEENMLFVDHVRPISFLLTYYRFKLINLYIYIYSVVDLGVSS